MGDQHRAARSVAVIVAFTLAYALGSMFVSNQYYQLMLTLVPIWAVMGLSWNILSGYSGLISFGHAAFFGLGAYTVTLMLVRFRHHALVRHSRRHGHRRAGGAGGRLSDVSAARPLFRAVDARALPARSAVSCSSGSGTKRWRCR